MDCSKWVEMLRRIPLEQHDNIVLMPVDGKEVLVQGILRLEPEYLVFRGRPMGSTETGRIFFLPYDQITYLNFYRAVKEPEIHAWHGNTDSGLPAGDASPAPVGESAPTGMAPEGSPAAPMAAVGLSTQPAGSKQPLKDKSALLRNLRGQRPLGSPPDAPAQG